MTREVVVAIVSAVIASAALAVAIVSAASAREQAASARAAAEAAKAQAESAGQQVAAAREQVAAARDQVAAAERQNELSEQLRRDQAQPYVVADVRPSAQSGHLLQVVVDNRGASIARDVQVRFDPPLTKRLGDDRSAFTALDGGISFLPPGRSMVWHLGTSFSYFEGDAAPPAITVTVDCVGPFGPMESLVYDLSLAELRGQSAEDMGTLAKIERAIKDLKQAVERRSR